MREKKNKYTDGLRQFQDSDLQTDVERVGRQRGKIFVLQHESCLSAVCPTCPTFPTCPSVSLTWTN